MELVEHSDALDSVGRPSWRNLLNDHRDAIERSETHTQFADAVNRLLKSTNVSHFKYYTDQDWHYWHLRSYFWRNDPDEDVDVEHVGIIPERIDGRWFVRGVLEGSAAASTMIRVGDEVLSVDGSAYSPVESFEDKAGRPVQIRLRRKPGLVYNVIVAPVKESLYRAMQEAMPRSIHVIEQGGFRMAYLHGWTLLGRGSEYRRLLEIQDDVDGLLLDYRDGFGGTPGVARRFLLGRRDHAGHSEHWA